MLIHIFIKTSMQYLKKIFLTFFFFFSVVSSIQANVYIDTKINEKRVKIIQHEINSEIYKLHFAINNDYEASRLRTLMEKYNGISAVNGIFFCPADYRECGGKNFTHNERYKNGRKIARDFGTGDRVVYGVDKKNIPLIFQTGVINPENESIIESWFWNFPLLLKDWESYLPYYKEKNLLDWKMKTSGTRNFICNDTQKKYIYFWLVFSASIEEMPDILKKLWCSDALNLDAGKSTAFIYNNRMIAGPGRDILDGIVIERKDLDTKKIRTEIEKVLPLLEKKLNFTNYENRIDLLDQIQRKIKQIRQQAYNKNSITLYNEDREEIGYEIHMDNKNNQYLLYYLHYLSLKLFDLKKKIIVTEKELQNSQDLLF